MKKVVLITGVSSGFGEKTAELLANSGFVVYGTVRKERDEIAGVRLLKMDLTDPQSINRAVDEVLVQEGKIDILINNAGMHSGGSVETSPLEHAKLQMDTNVTGMVHVIRAVLPGMRKQGTGTIINIGSIGGLMALPFQGFYSASKFAIEGLSEALRMELRSFNIQVVVINPGDFHTRNTQNRLNFLAPFEKDPYEQQYRKTLSIIEKDENNGWPPEKLAKKIVKIAGKKNPGHRYIIASFEQRLAVILNRLLPGKWFMRILASHYGIR